MRMMQMSALKISCLRSVDLPMCRLAFCSAIIIDSMFDSLFQLSYVISQDNQDRITTEDAP